MNPSRLIFAVFAVLGCSTSHADTRNPFDPTTVKHSTRKATSPPQGKALAPAALPTPPLPALPPVLPPPLPTPRAALPAESPTEQVDVGSKKKAKATPLQSTAASCPLKVQSESVAAPAYGGLVSISLQGNSKSCVSAVMVEQPWLEVQELNDAAAIRIAVDANESATPRQSNIVIANAGRSVTVTLVQEGRAARTR